MSVHELPLPVVAEVEEDWHIAHAMARESDVRMIERWLHQTSMLEERFGGDEQFAGALRSLAALARERRNGLADEARELRARAVEP